MAGEYNQHCFFMFVFASQSEVPYIYHLVNIERFHNIGIAVMRREDKRAI